MRKLGEALYGRMQAYETPLRAGDATGLAEALDRNVYAGGARTMRPGWPPMPWNAARVWQPSLSNPV